MGELAEEERIFESLPEWTRKYMEAWGSTRPDGKRMTVRWAAGFAGVVEDTVYQLRSRNRQFRTMEYLARHASTEFMASYTNAGLITLMPAILDAFGKLVDEHNAPVVIQAMKFLMGKPDVSLEGSMEFDVKAWVEKQEKRCAEVDDLEDWEQGGAASDMRHEETPPLQAES